MQVRAKIIVSGKVQGVLFRHSLRERALERGIFGYVRNLPNGEVEAELEGEKEQIESLIEWARFGPPAAKVEKLEFFWLEFMGEFSGFVIL